MLRFAVHSPRSSRVKVDASRGYLLGANDRAVSGKIRTRDGMLECQIESSKAAAVNIECETAEMGRLALSTCLLEQRDEPYQLMLELARHRIKHFIAKCEDWQVWDHPGAAEALSKWNEAREHFTAAMTSADSQTSEEHASKALVAGLKASERLAIAHAQILMHRRFGSRAASKLVLGVRADTSIQPTRAAATLKEFDMVSLPLPWSKIEVAPGAFDFKIVEPWLSWAATAGRTVLAGPLIDLREENIPKWVAAKRGDFNVLRDAIWKFAEAIGEKLGPHVRMWSLARGLDDGDWWPLDLESKIELARRAEVGLRKARKDVPTLLEIDHPFGHRVASCQGAVSPRIFVESLVNEGVHIDCLLLRILMGEPGLEHLTRDLLEVSALLDSYIPYRKPVFVELGAPSAPIDAKAGHWRAPWTTKSQAIWGSRLFSVAMSKPHVELVLWSGLADHGADGRQRGMLSSDMQPKPLVKALAAVRGALRKPLGAWRPTAETDAGVAKAPTMEMPGG